MILTEGTCLCLIAALFFLILAFKDLTRTVISPKYQVLKQDRPQGTTPSKPPASSGTASTSVATPQPSAKDEYMRRRAEIELQNREKWCKEFEEQELRKYFQGKHCQYMFNQGLNTAANRMMGSGNPYDTNTMGYTRGY